MHRRTALLGAAEPKRLRMEEALRESKERFRNLVETIKDWIWEVDAQGFYTYVSPRVRDILGYEPEDLLGRTPFDLMPREEAARIKEIFGDIVKAQISFDPIENICLHKDGHPVILETSGMPFFAEDGALKGYRGVDRDITERRHAEEALRKSEKEYRSVIENIQDVFYRSDLNGRLILGSPSGVKMFGYNSLEEMIGLPLESFWADPKDREVILAQMKASGSVRDYEAVLKRKDGTLFDAAFTTHFYYDNQGSLLGTEGTIRDITERKKGEEALRKNEGEAKKLAQETMIMAEIGKIISSTLNIEEVYERFVAEVRKLIPFDRISINVKDPGTDKVKVAYISGLDVPRRRAGTIFSPAKTFTADVIRTRSSLVVTPESMKELIKRFPGYLPSYEAGLRSLIAVPLISRDEVVGIIILSSNGQFRYGERELSLTEKVGNQISGAIANALIFAELKRMEEELRMAQLALETRVEERTAALAKTNKDLQAEITERKHAEELLKTAKEAAEASSIAKSAFLANMGHELRTPLNIIIGFSELMAEGQAGDLNETQKEYTGDVLQSSRHLLSLINDILDLSRVEAGKLELDASEVFLRDLLKNSQLMVKEKALKHGIQVSQEINGVPDWIRGDERKLKQILYNLLANAVKFTPEGGTVVLAARSLSYRQDNWVAGNDQGMEIPFQPAGESRWVEFSVRDTGIGLKQEDLERIFAPFEQADNTASRRYQGTGLGLSLTRRLVELHGGRIWGTSEGVGKGSTFSFVIPVDPRPEAIEKPMTSGP